MTISPVAAFTKRRAGEENGALILDDDGLVRHRRHIGAARRAGTHHHRDLRNAQGGHVGLVVEDPAEVLAIGKDVVLVGQVGPARVDQVDAGQAVLLRDLLRAQMLLDGDGIVGAALHGGVVRHDHALAPADTADAGDDAGRRHLAVVHPPRGELRQLQKGRADVQQVAHALARQQLAARRVLLPRRLAAALLHGVDFRTQIRHQRAHGLGAGVELGGA